MKKSSINENWRFYKEGEENNVKPVTLPHDAMIHEKRDPVSKSGSAGAFFPGGKYIYEKTLEMQDTSICGKVLLHFDGVYRNASVYVNGQKAGDHAYGYTPFDVDLNPWIKEADKFNVRVEVDNSRVPNSRWYSGSGIYRPVYLVTGPAEGRIEWQSLHVTTLSTNPAEIRVEAELSEGADSLSLSIAEKKSGKEVFSEQYALQSVSHFRTEVKLPGAVLWNAEDPNLYTCRMSTMKAGSILDEDSCTFGIREIAWSSKGLFVNGKNVLLRGGCIHHDSGILGAATFPEIEERRIRKLKKAGYNAIRSAHNPASEEMLNACDRIGMYVMDESWDMWYRKKTAYDYSSDFMPHYKEDLFAMVEKNYNHPSVLMYSIGNEVSESAVEKGQALAREMRDFVHSLDPFRPVTAGLNLMIISRSAKGNDIYGENGRDDEKQKKMGGMNSTMFNMITQMVGTGMNKAANSSKADRITSPVIDTLDIAGYNYASGRYSKEGKLHPKRVIMGSETFPQDIWKNWQMVKKYPYLIGDFMWTAWDYLGEAGIGGWAYTDDGKAFDKPYPWLTAEAGALDLIGEPTGEIFLAQAAWGLLSRPVLSVQPVNHPGVKPAKSVCRGTNSIPSWSFQGCEGNKAVIEVYVPEGTDRVELFLNGKLLGKKRVKEGKCLFHTAYEPGKLAARALDASGNCISEGILESAGKDLRLMLRPEEETVLGGQIFCVDICLTDEKGIIESNADRRVTLSVSGGELLAFGSANPRTEERYDSGSFSTYYGKAMAVIRAGENGFVKVKASADGLPDEYRLSVGIRSML